MNRTILKVRRKSEYEYLKHFHIKLKYLMKKTKFYIKKKSVKFKLFILILF